MSEKEEKEKRVKSGERKVEKHSLSLWPLRHAALCETILSPGCRWELPLAGIPVDPLVSVFAPDR